MPTIEHSTLTDPNLHEPKGVSVAAEGTVYVANGLGSGSWTPYVKKYVAAISSSAVSANTTLAQTFDVPGVVLGTDATIGVSKPTHQAGLGVVGHYVSADDQITVIFMNTTGSGITPTNAEDYTFHVSRMP